MRADLIQASYIAATLLFILGLKGMSSPRTARRGIVWAGVGMLVAVVATFFEPDMTNYLLMVIAVAIGATIAYVAAKKVAMVDMPQMVAIYNGMGGGAAALIAAAEFMHPSTMSASFAILGIIGALIGSISFSGSMIAFAKLQGLIKKSWLFPGQNVINLLVLAAAIVLGVIVTLQHTGAPHRARRARARPLLRPVAALRRAHDAAHRRRRHAGRDLALQRPHRPGRGVRRLRARQRRADHRRHRGRLRGLPAHAAHGQGHEPLAGQRALRRLRRQGRRRSSPSPSRAR